LQQNATTSYNFYIEFGHVDRSDISNLIQLLELLELPELLEALKLPGEVVRRQQEPRAAYMKAFEHADTSLTYCGTL